ncbi:MAG: NAD-dependent epimerase/dehydratase family protein [Acidimicrobiales bacterium]
MTSAAPPPPSRVLIVGAGDVGLSLAGRLGALGVDVTTLNRSGRSADGARAWRGDLADPATLVDLPMADTVIFTTAPPGRGESDYRLAYVDGPARILAALPSMPDRLVLTSTTGVYGVDDGSWVDETSPTEPSRASAAVVVEGERRLTGQATTTVIVRPAGIYGPGRGSLLERVRAGEEPVSSDGTPRWTNRVHRDDVVGALLVAATHPTPSHVLIAVDDEPAPRDDVIRHLVARLDAPRPSTIDVPSPTGKRCRNAALRALGWEPQYPTYREGYDALLR